MIVIGADTHKRNHTLVAVDGQTGTLRGQRQIPATDAGSLDACGSRSVWMTNGSGRSRTAGTCLRASRPR
jgi:hypothetical protein